MRMRHQPPVQGLPSMALHAESERPMPCFELGNWSSRRTPAESPANEPSDLWTSEPHAAEGGPSPPAASPVGSSKRRGSSTTVVSCFQLFAAYVVLVLAGIFVLFLLLLAGFWRSREVITTTTVRIETLRNEFGYFNPSAVVPPSTDYDSVSAMESTSRTPIQRALEVPINSTELAFEGPFS
ncbi:hypothetical protein HPB51_007781 [Rhipicephalus microplus]|uniref:Uncharacterized protein n=1 Tax=Rhipicephalus microplus TaxID=6941 RepID=A0A9J6EZD9_RHIMP|nr:hypothetical protein HPB51_007781 [Rhipicephalus microplus]